MAYKQRKVRKWHSTAILLFILYLIGLTYFLFFAPFLGRTGEETFYLNGLPLYGDYNLSPFKVIRLFVFNMDKVPFHMFFLNIFGNILCFMPFGFLLKAATGNKLPFGFCILAAAGTSIVFEFFQYYFAVGVGDIDDVILNTTGAALGYLVYYTILRAVRRNNKSAPRQAQGTKREPE